MGLETAAIIGLAGAALSAAGTGYQMSASNAEARRMNDEAKAEFIRQGKYQKQASGAFQKSLQDSTPAVQAQQQGEGTTALTDTMNKVAQTPVVTPSSVGNVAPDSLVGQEAQAKNKMSNAVTAQYGGMNEWQLRQWIKDLRAQQQLSLITNAARGSVNTLPLVLQQAQQSAEGDRAIGTGLSTIGGLAGAASSMGDTSTPSWMNMLRKPNINVNPNWSYKI